MTTLEWPPGVPARLRERAEELVATVDDTSPAMLLRAAVAATRALVQDDATARTSALDLLAADALVTDAIAGWTDNADTFEENCRLAMTTISSIVPSA